MKVEKIFFDMDGVLADFTKGAQAVCDFSLSSQAVANKRQDDAMWKAISKEEHFYFCLDLMPGAKEMFDVIYSQHSDRCEILTAIPKEKRGIRNAGEDKKEWVKKYLSEDIPVHIVYKEEKKNYCTGEGCILIDDLERNIEEWRTCGGTGILFESAEETIRKLTEMGVLVGD